MCCLDDVDRRPALEDWIYARAVNDLQLEQLTAEMQTHPNNDNDESFWEVIEKLKALPPPTVDLSDSDHIIADLRSAIAELEYLQSPTPDGISGVHGGHVLCRCCG